MTSQSRPAVEVAARGLRRLAGTMRSLVADRRRQLAPTPRAGADVYIDPRWYLRHYPDVARLGLNARDHYRRFGAAEGRAPGPLFNTAWYLAQVAEVLPKQVVEPTEALRHYLVTGIRAGLDPHPLVSASWYREQVPDLAPDVDPIAHYLAKGAAADVDPHPLFNSRWYRERHGLDADTNPLLHFLRSEPEDEIDGSPYVDRAFYLHKYPDVATLGLDPVLHWATFGAPEGRTPHPLFDPQWYVERHPDAGPVGVAALAHHLREGAAAGLSPSPLLDVRWYLERYPEAVDAGGAFPHAVLGKSAQDVDPNPYVDSVWYRATYADARGSSLTALTHYLTIGADKGYDPSPRFETTWYLSAYRDVADYGINPLVHFLVDGDYEGREPTAGHDPVPRLLGPEGGWFTRQLAAAAAHEPLLSTTTAEGLRDHTLATRAPRSPARDAMRTLLSSLDRIPDRVVLVPALPLGGAERVAANAANGVAELFPDESVLVLATDATTDTARHWFDECVDVRFLEADGRLDLSRRGTTLARFVDAMRPRSVLNVNSHAGWDMLERHGVALAQHTSLSAALFCRDYSIDGVLGGYADRYFRSTFTALESLYSDHKAFVRELCDTYGVPEAERRRLHPVYQPVPVHPLADADRERIGPRRVLWAGRLTYQKRPDLLLAAARALPEVTFEVHGSADERHRALLEALPPNVKHHGAFRTTDELPWSHVDAFLYTSAWDGLPNTLLEVVGRGVPVVATDVGGIGELLTPDTGTTVDGTVEAIVAGLHQVLADLPAARARARAAHALVAQRHSWSAFTAALARTPFATAPKRGWST